LCRIFSVGHSKSQLDVLVQLLRIHSVSQLADVRSYPTSRRHPHFSRVNLETALPSRGIAYRWMPGLGGLRLPVASSTNTGWRVEGFRAYADHMQTPDFAMARAELEAWADSAPTAFMCAEADFHQCHRQLLADALVVRGWEVLHIASATASAQHTLTGFARVGKDGYIDYPGDPELPLPSPRDSDEG
jgi:uncharacterized protein (DUF488 family)